MSNRAWVTLATNDSYGLGALVLAHSLRQAGSQYPAVVLITPSVTDAMRERLRAVFAEVVTVDVLDSRDATHLALLQRPELGITFTKIHCWNLTQYEKCVFLDADTLVVQNCDELFEREELSAAPDVGWPDCFNSGVFVFSPSTETFTRLVAFAQERGSFDGGDQGLLNSFFSDWARGDINKHLPFLYNVTSAAFYSYLPALKHYGQDLKIIHFIGAAKPWLQHFNFESRTVDAPEHIKGLLQLWWDIFTSQVHTQLETSMSGVAGNLARVVPGTASHEALDDLTRRQGWEAGNIDYMGADSFDKIWAKISQTLNQPRVSPPKEPSPPKQPEPQLAQAEAPKESEVVEVTKETVPVEVLPATAPEPTSVKAEEPAQPPAPEVTSVSEQPPAPEPVKVETQVSEQPPAPEPVKVETAVSEQPPAPEPVKVETPVSEQPPAPEPVKVETPVTEPEKASTAEQPPAEPLKVVEPVIAPTSVETVTDTAPNVETPAVAPAVAVKPEPVKVSEPVVPEQPVSDKSTEAAAAVPVAEKPVDKPIEPVVEPKKTETKQKPETPAVEQKEPVVESLKASEQIQTTPASPTKAEEAPAKTAATPEATKAPAVTDSPPLANTPSKEEAPAVPAAKLEERRKPAGKLQLAAPGVADPLPTPDSELEDAATIAHAIIASELRTPTVTGAPDSPAAPTSPPAPKEPRKLSVEEPQVPTPPVGAVSLAQIGVKPKDKTTTAEQIESSIAATATPATPPVPAADAPKKKVVKKSAKKDSATASSGDVPAPVPPPRKKEKKPKEK